MPSPPSERDRYWRRIGESAWRPVDTDPLPQEEPETVFEWLTRRWSETPIDYRRRAELGALPSYRAPAKQP